MSRIVCIKQGGHGTGNLDVHFTRHQKNRNLPKNMILHREFAFNTEIIENLKSKGCTRSVVATIFGH